MEEGVGDEHVAQTLPPAAEAEQGTQPSVRSPSEMFVNLIGGMVDQDDVRSIITQQVMMMNRFEKTNEKLECFNTLEAGRFNMAMEQFRSHTRVLTDMKKDLDSVFRRIRLLRGKLARQYPEMFEAYEKEHPEDEEEEEEEEAESDKPTTQDEGQSKDSDELLNPLAEEDQ